MLERCYHAVASIGVALALLVTGAASARADDTEVQDPTPVPVAASGSAAASSPVRDWANSPWRFDASILGWLPKAPVRIEIGSTTVGLPEKFDNIFDSIEMFAMLAFEVHKGPIGLFANSLYFKGRDDERFTGPLGERRKVTLSETVYLVDYGASYVFGPWDVGKNVSLTVEPYGGFRFFNDNLKLELHPDSLGAGFRFRDTLRFNTPIVGVRTHWDITDRSTLHVAGDRGGWDVDDVKKTYQWYATVDYRFKIRELSSRVFAGYRELHVHYEKSADIHVWIRGPVIGIGFEF